MDKKASDGRVSQSGFQFLRGLFAREARVGGVGFHDQFVQHVSSDQIDGYLEIDVLPISLIEHYRNAANALKMR